MTGVKTSLFRPNYKIRKMIFDSGIPQYEIAYRIGISETTFIRWLRHEIPERDPRYQRIMTAFNSKEDGQ